MDDTLQNVIEKIRQEGVVQAQQESEKIIENAQRQAKEIVEGASKEARGIIQQAESKAEQATQNAQSAIGQAARDVMLSLKEKIQSLFDRILQDAVQESLTPEVIVRLVVALVDKWTPQDGLALEVGVSEADCKKVAELLKAELKKKASAPLEVKVTPEMESGFRIGVVGQDVHYDFTDQSVQEALSVFLNPQLQALLKRNDG